MKPSIVFLTALLLKPTVALLAEDGGIAWIVRYDGQSLPASPWKSIGQANATLEDGALHLSDDSKDDMGAFEAEWTGDLDGTEIIVEARVKLVSMVGHRDSPTATWPQRDGAPICIQVSDGKHVEGILLTPAQDKHPEAAKGYVRTLTDRFAQADTRDAFHTYRLIIRGEDMAVEMDGKRIIEGRDAFWRPATSPRKFIRFGSTSKPFTGEAQWEFVRLGLRPAASAVVEKSPLKITVSEPWPLSVDKKNTESRPYLYDMGQGLLLTSNPQGSDALLEPYIVRRSTDQGKTWQAVPGTEQNSDSPQELVRLADGRILGPSRWTHLQSDGRLTGKTSLLDAKAEKLTMHDSTVTLPAEFMPAKTGEVLLFERHIWAEKDGSITAVAWSRTNQRDAERRFVVTRHTHLLRSADLGKTWAHLAHVGLGGEPAVVRLSDSEWLAVTRPDAHMSNLLQHRSLDGGKTWKFERTLEEGSVMPDLVLMSNGVLACSYGRPVSNLMFSLDGGRTWRDHRVISDRANFNYTAIREISPGRLLYMHDGQIPGTLARINSLYIEVEKVKP
ncbi:MAG: sialidase family protein [Verrucomicrobiaceae bacterium]|nr:sialidase family protein [Verrucomicrobiaceae bacterium]